MTTSDYLINGVFLLVVLRQARERRLDTRSIVAPLAMVALVGQQYLHSIPTDGNDLLFIATLAAAGVGLGAACGFATHVRADRDGSAYARVGWLAGALLVVGISSRMVFSLAVSNGFEPSVASFSQAIQVTAAAWPVALVSMAICEVATRILTVHVRGLLLTETATAATAPTFA
ncbi:MAG TPA: hypothetical protein VFO60_12220 [Candidatus Dormibacteraeota bacterium]|nr:hypothetical protein [Candidatus Dormibacteraeota bacterium]